MNSMLRESLYITPAGFMKTVTLLGAEFNEPYGAESYPGDPTQDLVTICWQNPNCEREFETLIADNPAVIPLGAPWEHLPAAAVPFLTMIQDHLAAYADTPVLKALSRQATISADSQTTETVYSAMRKLGRILR